jgi:RNA polymerase sigma factor (sigma-70 family)
MSFMAPSDRELVVQTRQGTAGALAMLLERHRAGLTSVVVRILGPGPDVEDIVHETFLVALSRIDRLREPESVGPWLMGIARNLCLQRLRAAREVPVDTLEPPFGTPDEADPEQAIDRTALRDWVWSALDTLSEPLRLAVILRHFSSTTSYRDIAPISGVPIGTVRSRLNQARAKLAEALLDEGGRRG